MDAQKISREQMHAELREVLYQFVRCAAFVSSEKIAPALLGSVTLRTDPMFWIYDPDAHAEEVGFEPKGWQIVQTMDRLYDYALHGIARMAVVDMGGETEYAFTATFLYDVWRSALVSEINNGEGAPVKHCLHIAQLAAARVALDGGERFFGFGRFLPDDALTLREIALLAGMEEASVRNAAVRGKAGALKTFQEDGNTLVRREEALAWLKGRKGFIPTTRRYELGEIDLTKQSFKSLGEIDDFLQARCQTLGLTSKSLAKKLEVSIEEARKVEGLYFTENGSLERKDLERLAAVLQLDPRLFVLRVRETTNLEEARRIQRELASLASPNS